MSLFEFHNEMILLTTSEAKIRWPSFKIQEQLVGKGADRGIIYTITVGENRRKEIALFNEKTVRELDFLHQQYLDLQKLRSIYTELDFVPELGGTGRYRVLLRQQDNKETIETNRIIKPNSFNEELLQQLNQTARLLANSNDFFWCNICDQAKETVERCGHIDMYTVCNQCATKSDIYS